MSAEDAAQLQRDLLECGRRYARALLEEGDIGDALHALCEVSVSLELEEAKVRAELAPLTFAR